MIELLLRDGRYALRGFVRNPIFSTVAVVTLALGIGANTAMFSVVRGVVLRPLPFPDPERLVRLEVGVPFSARQLDGLEERLQSYEALAGARPATLTLTGDGPPEEVAASVVGTSHMRVFGVPPALGRGFTAGDGPGEEAVAVLSHDFWERRFGGDPDVVGRTVRLGGEGATTRTVIGVMPPGYRPFTWSADAFIPIAVEPGSHEYTDMFSHSLVARLTSRTRPGVAQRELGAVVRRMATGADGAYFADPDPGDVRVVSYLQAQVGGVSSALWALLAAVGIVLLIACTNVANLQLARSAARRREMAVRTALGAARGRIVAQLLIESLLLASIGGAIGYVATSGSLPLLLAALPPDMPRVGQIAIDGGVLAFTVGVSLLAGLVFGLAPVLDLGSTGAAAAVPLADGGRTSAGRRSHRLNRGLVAAELALCVILVASAGLVLKSFLIAGQVDPGFRADDLVTVRLRPDAGSYSDVEDRRQYVREVRAAVASLPGVVGVGATQVLPMSGGTMGVGISPDGAPVPRGNRPLIVGYRIVTVGYGETLGLPLLEGRWITDSDRTDAPRVGLINERMAERMFPTGSPVGREVRWDNGELWFTVVGVVGNVHHDGLDRDTDMEAYVPFEQEPWTAGLHLVVRSDRGTGILSSVRGAIWSVDANVPLSREASMADLVGASLDARRFQASLLGAFGGLALVLGAVGVYGVTAYTLSQRRREVGVRMALGARSGIIVRELFSSSLTPVLTGLGAGLVGALLTGRLLTRFLFQVDPVDAVVLGATLAFLAGVAGVATLVPARRAARVDPMVVLGRG